MLNMYNLKCLIEVLVVTTLFPCTVVTTRCPLTGPVLTRPINLSTSSEIHSAGQQLKQELESAIAGKVQAGWAVKNTSFSLALVSLSNNAPIWEYHHLASANTRGTKIINRDSQYLIGSISKVFTDLLLYKIGLDPRDPVTKYLPRLKGKNTPINWDEVTLERLADHTSGIPITYGFPEIYPLVPVYESLGFPKLNKSDFPPCGVTGLNKGCSQKQLETNMRNSHPVAPPGLRSVYSSIAFTLLAGAMQNATGKSYAQLLDSLIVKPLGLTNTGVSPGNTPRAVIPPGMSSWGADYGIDAPGGGLYSSTADLCTFMHEIFSFSSKILPTTSAVRSWLQPHSMTSSVQDVVGAPWEIYRPSNPKLFPQNVTPRTLKISAKDGAAQSYIARMAMLEEYGVGFSFLTAGAKGATAVNALSEAAFARFIPAIEAATRREAKAYLGTFRSKRNSTASDKGQRDDEIPASGKLTLSMDSGPGLLLTKLTRNGHDMIESIRKIWTTQVVYVGKLAHDLRLYPIDITHSSTTSRSNSGNDYGGHDTVEEEWRLLLEPEPIAPKSGLPTAATTERDTGVFESWCNSWQSQDSIYYGGEPIDRFVIVKDARTKEVIGVKAPSLRMEFWR